MVCRLIVLVIATLVACSAGGCSVAMAASGKPDPNIAFLRVGATRGEVETQVGHPITTVQSTNGLRVDTYEYKLGAESSPGRATAHAVLDVLTLGIWEVVGTPIEATQLGTKYRVTLTYDSSDKVIAVNEPAKAEPAKSDVQTSTASPPTSESTAQSSPARSNQ